MGQIPPQATIKLPGWYKRKYEAAKEKSVERKATADKGLADWLAKFDSTLDKVRAECEKIAKGEPSEYTFAMASRKFNTAKVTEVIEKIKAKPIEMDEWGMLFPDYSLGRLESETRKYIIGQYEKIVDRAKKDLATVEEQFKRAKAAGANVKKTEPKKEEPKKEEPKKTEPELTPEQKREKALEEVSSYVGNTPMNIRLIFQTSVGKQYLKDKDIVMAIIQRYPQAMVGLSNSYLARNLEDVTKSYVAGVVDICKNPKDSRERFIGGPVTSGRDGSLFAIDEATYVETILGDAKESYSDRMHKMSMSAIEIVKTDKEKYGKESKFSEVDEKKLHIVEQGGRSEFPDKIEGIKSQAKKSAEVIVVEEREL